MKNGKQFANMPFINPTINPKHALEAAIDALKAANLDEYVNEMVNRFMHVNKAKEGLSIDQQRFAVVLDYVYFKNPDEPADEYPDELDGEAHILNPGQPMSDSNVPF
jgi:hypothetical protein